MDAVLLACEALFASLLSGHQQNPTSDMRHLSLTSRLLPCYVCRSGDANVPESATEPA